MNKKLLNQFLCIFCSAIAIIGTSTTVFATDSYQTYFKDEITEAVKADNLQNEHNFTMDAEPVIDNGITPYKTIVGNGGSCTIDYMSSAKHIAWGVKPATNLVYTFTGMITVYTNSTGALKGFGACYGMGTGTENGTVDLARMGLRSGTTYKAVFTGTATDFLGKNFHVSSGASLTFTYYK
jgi:hypothetical protein